MLGSSNGSELLSVVIPTHDRPDSLRRLLASIDHLSGTCPSEVIVVDDASSTLRTQYILGRWVKREHPYEARVLTEPESRGPGHARNHGVEVATRELVAFTDDDCVVEPRWLSRILERLRFQKSLAGVGGRVLPLDHDVVSMFYNFHRILDPPPSLLYLVSANCCYRRDAFLSVGGYDEDLRRPGGEDIGLSFRLSREGWKFGFAPDAIVYHDYRNNPLDFIRTFWNYGRGSRLVTEKAYGTKHGHR